MLKGYEEFVMGPHLDPEINDEVEAEYETAAKSGKIRIALIWAWCGGREVKAAIDGRGRQWQDK